MDACSVWSLNYLHSWPTGHQSIGSHGLSALIIHWITCRNRRTYFCLHVYKGHKSGSTTWKRHTGWGLWELMCPLPTWSSHVSSGHVIVVGDLETHDIWLFRTAPYSSSRIDGMTGQVKVPKTQGQDASLPEPSAARSGQWLTTLVSATSSKEDDPITWEFPTGTRDQGKVSQ